ncbi:MAG: sarcosine/dimethylglycine N-methyltransferase [Gaiellaceae bacterium]|nr:sarcosine/dimethylglycine N-methyltransferase [Gaiellaceae bacterium]
MTSARELYKHWAADPPYDPRTGESLDPRGTEWLFELFASLGPKPGDFLVDVGARDGKHFRRLVDAHGLRGLAIDPVPNAPDVVEGVIEELPLEDESVDWIWARDMLVHVDLEPAFAECVRVLKPGGRMLAYVTLATDELEPRERAWLTDAIVIVNWDGERIEAAASALTLEQKIELGSEWRERMIEDGTWDPTDALLRLARMRRLGIDSPIDRADLSWGIYQLLGKTCPTVYVWSKTSSD